uniref:Uncharacterized protein n=1 Tax=viral metagenome TaxID=1070528 RepID=A0A6C0ERC7_9ZZZZ
MLKLAYEVHTLVIVLLEVSVLKQVRFAEEVGQKAVVELQELAVVKEYILEHPDI